MKENNRVVAVGITGREDMKVKYEQYASLIPIPMSLVGDQIVFECSSDEMGSELKRRVEMWADAHRLILTNEKEAKKTKDYIIQICKYIDRPFKYAGLSFVGLFRLKKGSYNTIQMGMHSNQGIGNYDYLEPKGLYYSKYSHTDFYAEAGEQGKYDLFYCIETGKLYIPGENELFRVPCKLLAKVDKQAASWYVHYEASRRWKGKLKVTLEYDFETTQDMKREDVIKLLKDSYVMGSYLHSKEEDIRIAKLCNYEKSLTTVTDLEKIIEE